MDRHTFSDGQHTYSVTKLWTLCAGMKSGRFDIHFFDGYLLDPCWSDAEGPVRPAEVLDYPDFYPEHWARINGANLRYPILVSATRGYIIDGVHRLCRALREGHQKIRVTLVRDAILEAAREQ